MAQPRNYMINVPDPTKTVTGGIMQGLQLASAVDKYKLQQAEAERKRKLASALQVFFANPNRKYEDLERVLPFADKQQLDALQAIGKNMGERRLNSSKAFYGQLLMAIEYDPAIAQTMMETRIEAEQDPNQKEAFKSVLETMKATPKKAGEMIEYLGGATFGKDWYEGITKVREERRTADLFPELYAERQAERSKAQSEAEIAAIDAKYHERMQQALLAKAKLEAEAQGNRVQSSKILPDGTTIIVTSSGKTLVQDPSGKELTGQDRAEAVRRAQLFGADVQGWRAGSREGSKIGQKEAQKAFENVGKIRKNITNLDAAIAALDAGANTGAIASKFPDWKASSIELRNIQRQLGLDVIGSVTFGALSEGELSLALETALPLNMSEAELKDWLIRKKTAQTKLADYITEQAQFLSVPGRTLGDWLQRAEERGGQPGGVTAPGTGTTPAAPTVNVNGKVYRFRSQQEADQFRKAAGI